MFNASRKPVLIAGIEIHRYKASRDLVELAEKMGAPVFTTVLGKGAFPMDHPLYMGVHVGPISPPPIVARMDEADFVLNLGCLKTDMNFGNRPPHIIQDQDGVGGRSQGRREVSHLHRCRRARFRARAAASRICGAIMRR